MYQAPESAGTGAVLAEEKALLLDSDGAGDIELELMVEASDAAAHAKAVATADAANAADAVATMLPTGIPSSRYLASQPATSPKPAPAAPAASATVVAAGGSEASCAETNYSMTQCVVCLSDFEQGDVLVVLPCQHQFHKVRLGCRSSALSSATFHPSLSLPHRRTACSRG